MLDSLGVVLAGEEVTLHADHSLSLLCAVNSNGSRAVLWTRLDSGADSAVQNFLLANNITVYCHASIAGRLEAYTTNAARTVTSKQGTCLLFEYQSVIKVYTEAMRQSSLVRHVAQSVKVILAADTVLLRHTIQPRPADGYSIEEQFRSRVIMRIIASCQMQRCRENKDKSGAAALLDGEEDVLGDGHVVFERLVKRSANADNLLFQEPKIIKQEPGAPSAGEVVSTAGAWTGGQKNVPRMGDLDDVELDCMYDDED